MALQQIIQHPTGTYSLTIKGDLEVQGNINILGTLSVNEIIQNLQLDGGEY